MSLQDFGASLYFRRHANALTQRWVRVNRFADVHCVRAHLDPPSVRRTFAKRGRA